MLPWSYPKSTLKLDPKHANDRKREHTERQIYNIKGLAR